MITDNGIGILAALAQYYLLCRPQIQRLRFPHHREGRSTRKHLSKLVHGGYIKKHTTMIPYPTNGSGCPCYYLTQRGAEILASYYDDPRYKDVNTKAPRADMMLHWLALNETRLDIEDAVSVHPEIELLAWYSEWQTIFDESGREQFYLHTVFERTPPLSCSPDAAFLLKVQGFKKVHFLEIDRNTSGARSIGAIKPPGYAELHKRQQHKRHFPESNVDTFTVLMVTTHKTRRNRLAEAVDDKPGATLWKFVVQDDITSVNFPYAPVFLNSKGEAKPLVNRPDRKEGVA